MGNCLRHESEMAWGGEDWGSIDRSSNNTKNNNECLEKLRLLSDEMRHNNNSHNNNDCNGGREVKIRISKKELEQIVGVQGMPMDRLLSYLIINGHDRPDHGHHVVEHHRLSWRPVLQSIPEVN